MLQARVLGGLREVAVHLSEESAAMNSSTMCILACIVAVLAVNGSGGLGQGRGARSVCVTARRDAKLPPHSICMPSSMRNHVQTMNLRFRTAFLMTGAIPFETEIQTSSTTHMSAAFVALRFRGKHFPSVGSEIVFFVFSNLLTGLTKVLWHITAVPLPVS